MKINNHKNLPVAIVLGGTLPHVNLVGNLKERGYFVLLVDYLENPPAKEYCDFHAKISTLDVEEVFKLTKKVNAELIISTSIDQANVVACKVGEMLGLPIPYSSETALNVTDKVKMKQILKENNIPTSNFKVISEIDQFNTGALIPPFVVKPADTTGSKGVKKVNDIEALIKAFNEAKALSRSGEVVVEEFNQGKEIQVDYFISNGTPHKIMSREKLRLKVSGLEDQIELQSLGSMIPIVLSNKIEEKLEAIIHRIVSIFKLKNTSLFIQANITNDSIKVIEFACRVGGGLSFYLIKKIKGFDILDATIDSFLGRQPSLQLQQSDFYFATTLLYCYPGIFKEIRGIQKLIKDSIIEDFFVFKTSGSEIFNDFSSRNRIGALVTKGKTQIELFEKINKSIKEIQIIDINGENIIHKIQIDNNQ